MQYLKINCNHNKCQAQNCPINVNNIKGSAVDVSVVYLSLAHATRQKLADLSPDLCQLKTCQLLGHILEHFLKSNWPLLSHAHFKMQESCNQQQAVKFPDETSSYLFFRRPRSRTYFIWCKSVDKKRKNPVILRIYIVYIVCQYDIGDKIACCRVEYDCIINALSLHSNIDDNKS